MFIFAVLLLRQDLPSLEGNQRDGGDLEGVFLCSTEIFGGGGVIRLFGIHLPAAASATLGGGFHSVGAGFIGAGGGFIGGGLGQQYSGIMGGMPGGPNSGSDATTFPAPAFGGPRLCT